MMQEVDEDQDGMMSFREVRDRSELMIREWVQSPQSLPAMPDKSDENKKMSNEGLL